MRKTFYKVLIVFATAIIILAACAKENTTKLDPKLSTSLIMNLTSDSVDVVGFVVASGSGFTEKGVCFNTDSLPTIANNKVIYNGPNTTATFTVRLKVNRLTNYFVRAYAINANGTIYGQQFSFKTPAALPILANIIPSVLAATIDNGVTASTDINITDDGGPDPKANITKRGVVFGMTPHPTVDSVSSKLPVNATIATSEGTGKGQFTSLATNLKGAKKYYLRAYATNKIGTGYSNEVTFTTPIGYATISTNAATKINKTTATLNGLLINNGGGTVTERGFCYSTNLNPTISDTKVTVPGTKDSISADISGLTLNTTYHVRAYVTNDAGTNYGADVPFTTLADIIKIWVVGAFNGWTNDDTAPFIISTATSNGDCEGYIYFSAAGGLKLVTDHSWDNAHTFGDNGSGALTNPGNNISVPSAGYYLVKANLGTMTYSLTLTTWSIIGNATPGGWSTDTQMTYDPATKLWSVYATLTQKSPPNDGLKFRANDDWTINYGSTKGDSTLDINGTNIGVPAGGDYYIVLNLSRPNNYVYHLTTWGLIGSAIPVTGWNSDQNMSWDAVNKVWKITLDLNAGDIKFRANDAWDINLGGDINALTYGGGNISIATAGNYTITLDTKALVATITQNKKK